MHWRNPKPPGWGGFFMGIVRCLPCLSFIVIIVHGVSFWNHALVQDAGNQNSLGFLAVKDNMLATLHSAQAAANILTASADLGIIGQHPAKCLQTVDVAERLIFAPGPQGINTDPQQIGFGTAR
jgi:hypothetical protein